MITVSASITELTPNWVAGYTEDETYNGMPVVRVGNVSFYPGDFGHETDPNRLRKEAEAYSKLARLLDDAASWCLNRADAVMDAADEARAIDAEETTEYDAFHADELGDVPVDEAVGA